MKLRIKGFKLSEGNLWDASQIRMFCENAVKSIGGLPAWNILSEPLKRAVVAQEAFSVARSSWREGGVPTDAMNALLHDMERMIGLEDDDA